MVSKTQTYLSIADAFCMLSREDPMPLIAIEAGAIGLPVVCFALAGGTPDWLGASGGGRVVPYLDVRRAAQAINEYSTNRRTCVADGQRAQKHCLAHFSINAIGPQVISIVQRLLDETRHQ